MKEDIKDTLKFYMGIHEGVDNKWYGINCALTSSWSIFCNDKIFIRKCYKCNEKRMCEFKSSVERLFV